MWCDVECVTMLLHHALPHHTTTCGVVRCGIKYGMSQQHNSTSNCTTFHINRVHTMLCHIAPPHTAHHVICGVLSCDMEWACGMWCGAMWNAIQCYHTMLDASHHHILHITAAHFNTTPQQHNSSTFHISSCYTVQTTRCHITPPCIAHHEMWCDGA